VIKHDVIGLYVTLNGKQRIDFLINHYRDFDRYVSSYKEYVRSTMLDILDSYRVSSDELGVRVQTGGGNSDPTFEGANKLASVDECFKDKSLVETMFKDAYGYELISLALYELERLQKEFRKLNATMDILLKEDDQEILKSYFKHERRLYELANDLCIEIESANKKVYRIRKKLVNSIKPWFDEYNMKASA